MQDLNDLYYFVQVVDHGGFAPAGRALGMPKSKLSRRIALLEERFGGACCSARRGIFPSPTWARRFTSIARRCWWKRRRRRKRSNRRGPRRAAWCACPAPSRCCTPWSRPCWPASWRASASDLLLKQQPPCRPGGRGHRRDHPRASAAAARQRSGAARAGRTQPVHGGQPAAVRRRARAEGAGRPGRLAQPGPGHAATNYQWDLSAPMARVPSCATRRASSRATC